MIDKDDAKKLYKHLRKKGLALIEVSIAPHGDDSDFVTCPITCSVIAVSTKKGKISEQIKDENKWQQLKSDKTVTLEVDAGGFLGAMDTFINIFKSKKKTPELFEIHLLGRLSDSFVQHYEPYSKIFTMKAGDSTEHTLQFKPKSKISRFDKAKLDEMNNTSKSDEGKFSKRAKPKKLVLTNRAKNPKKDKEE